MKALCHSAVPRRDFLPGPKAAGREEQGARRGWVRPGQAPARGQEAAQPGSLPGKVFQGLPISHLAPCEHQDGQEWLDALWGNQGHWLQGHNLRKREGAGQSLPLPQKHKPNSGCSEGLVVCRAGGWD